MNEAFNIKCIPKYRDGKLSMTYPRRGDRVDADLLKQIRDAGYTVEISDTIRGWPDGGWCHTIGSISTMPVKS